MKSAQRPRCQAWTGLRVRNFGGAILRAAGLPLSIRTRGTEPASSATPGLRVTIAAMMAPSINNPIWCASVAVLAVVAYAFRNIMGWVGLTR